jgi:hypothetical protein
MKSEYIGHWILINEVVSKIFFIFRVHSTIKHNFMYILCFLDFFDEILLIRGCSTQKKKNFPKSTDFINVIFNMLT